MYEELGKYGVWRPDRTTTPELAATVEKLGYGALWIGGSPGGDLKLIEDLLDATETLRVATGITNIWKDDAKPIAAAWHRIEARHPGRFLLGIGVGHPEAVGKDYSKPYQALVEYLDALDAEGVPASSRVVAALGPKVLELAAERSLGAHPYLTTPEHTRRAREIMGAGALLAPEQKAVLKTDPDEARAVGRPVVKNYLGLVNYTNMLRSVGFTDEDLAGEGSDRLIDALAVHGTPADVAAVLNAHLDAGADHVCVQVLTAAGADPVPDLSALAKVLFE
jgi:probable F420-dependent oxidoreductase